MAKQAKRIQAWTGDRDALMPFADAIKLVPTALIEDVALIGPAAKIAEDLERWKATCLTTMLISGPRLFSAGT